MTTTAERSATPSWGSLTDGATARARRVRTEPVARPRPADQHEAPELRVVRGVVPARATLPFLLLVVVILAGALIASMILNAQMADTAFKMKAAQVELNVLSDHIETVRADVQDVSAPDALAARAAELGMVPAAAPGVVDLNSSTVAGGAPAAEPGEQSP